MVHADNKYIDGIRNNDKAIIQDLYTRFFSKIKGMIISNGGIEADADDIFQDALVSIFRQVKQTDFTLTCPMDAYLYIICKNKWISRRKTIYASRVTFTDNMSYTVGEDVFAEAEKITTASAKRKLLEKKIMEMEEGCRNLLKLSWEGIPLEQIARLLNTTYGYIRKKKSVCTDKLIGMVRQSPEFALLKW